MNNLLFDQAQQRYQRKDYEGALMSYTKCLQDTQNPLAPGEMGLVYHQIGNCLVKLKNPSEAIHAYTQATADPAYQAMGTVECNLGMAYASLRDYDNAIRCFEIATADPSYTASYKAYMGMGNALMKIGKNAEAGVAFREAALDESNPDPTKALLNLGVCFMALNRPADAVASYENALPFVVDAETRNKLYASLGQAYVACGQMEKAVDAFERAIADKTYYLSDSASVDYQRAVAAVATGAADQTLALEGPADMTGLDIAADGTSVYEEGPYTNGQDPFYYDDGYNVETYPGYVGVYEEGEERFFNSSDEELEQWSKGLAKQDRKRRNVWLKVLIVVIVLVILACAGIIFAYTQGFGFPTQESVTQQLFEDPGSAAEKVFSPVISSESAESLLDPVVQDSDVTINAVQRSMGESTVYATATTSSGGEVHYKIGMIRDFLGWKISNIELYFPSQNA